MSANPVVLKSDDLVQPYFALSGRHRKEKIPNMSGIFRMSNDLIVKDVTELLRLGVRRVLLFGVARCKNPIGSDSCDPQGAIQQAVLAIREKFGNKIIVITDACLCGFTDHGHCGVLKGKKIDQKKTLEALGKIAVSHAEAGVDFVAPSAMTQGQVQVVRTALDRANFRRTGVWAYAIKYASSFYRPFRGALGSAPKFGDRKAYQMNPADPVVAIRSALRDQKSGADILMVKPALPYLDIIFQLKQKVRVPVAAFHVSGEYGMLKAGAQGGVLGEKAAVLESLLAIRRAGADKIVTYYAKQAAKWLKEDHD